MRRMRAVVLAIALAAGAAVSAASADGPPDLPELDIDTVRQAVDYVVCVIEEEIEHCKII